MAWCVGPCPEVVIHQLLCLWPQSHEWRGVLSLCRRSESRLWPHEPGMHENRPHLPREVRQLGQHLSISASCPLRAFPHVILPVGLRPPSTPEWLARSLVSACLEDVCLSSNTAGTVFRESVFPLPPTPPRMMPGISAAAAHPGPGGLTAQNPPPPYSHFQKGLSPHPRGATI